MNHPSSPSDETQLSFEAPSSSSSNPELKSFSSAVSQSLHLQHMDTLPSIHKMNSD